MTEEVQALAEVDSAPTTDVTATPEVAVWTDSEGAEQSSTRLIKDEGEAQVANQIARQLAQKESEPALPWTNV